MRSTPAGRSWRRLGRDPSSALKNGGKLLPMMGNELKGSQQRFLFVYHIREDTDRSECGYNLLKQFTDQNQPPSTEVLATTGFRREKENCVGVDLGRYGKAGEQRRDELAP